MGWKDINWHKVERYVFKLQKRIYAASLRGDVRQARKLQKTLMRSWCNKVLAVRKVTTDNRGKKTAGVDGVTKKYDKVGQARKGASINRGLMHLHQQLKIKAPIRGLKYPLFFLYKYY